MHILLKAHFSLVFLSIILAELKAQDLSKVDSLELILTEQIESDTNKVLTLYELAIEFENIDIHKVTTITNEIRSISDSINYLPGLARAHYLQAVIYLHQSKFKV